MRPGGGKAKGNGFEGLVAKKLSIAFEPLKFIRTQSSGARVGGKNFETLGQMFGEEALKLFVGDVVPVNEKESGVKFKHAIETKFYKTPDSFPALVSLNANVFKWVQEAIDDAVKVNRNPLLIFKWNNTPIFVAMPKSDSILMPDVRLIVIPSIGVGTPIQIAYFDDLLKHPNFWFDGVLQSKKETGNESEESQGNPQVS